eukprot:754933-Hanusia_phi.AAC.3
MGGSDGLCRANEGVDDRDGRFDGPGSLSLLTRHCYLFVSFVVVAAYKRGFALKSDSRWCHRSGEVEA